MNDVPASGMMSAVTEVSPASPLPRDGFPVLRASGMLATAVGEELDAVRGLMMAEPPAGS